MSRVCCATSFCLSSYLHLSFVQQFQDGVELEAIAEVPPFPNPSRSLFLTDHLRLPCLLVEVRKMRSMLSQRLISLIAWANNVLTAALDGRFVRVLVNELKRPCSPSKLTHLNTRLWGHMIWIYSISEERNHRDIVVVFPKEALESLQGRASVLARWSLPLRYARPSRVGQAVKMSSSVCCVARIAIVLP